VKLIKQVMHLCGRCLTPITFDPISPKELIENGYAVGRCENLKFCEVSGTRVRIPVDIIDCEEHAPGNTIEVAVGNVLAGKH
jgi:hypothetical protein